MSQEDMVAAVDDPAWLRSKYEEAKALIEDIRVDFDTSLADDLRERLEDFRLTTFMDRCTTMGLDCGCNELRSYDDVRKVIG